MANCFDYLAWRGDVPFSVAKFNEVDGMLLSRFAYAPFELCDGKFPMKVSEACKKMLAHDELDGNLVHKDDKLVIEGFLESDRFSSLYVFGYEDTIDTESETQFSAVTVKLAPDLYYIAFRGTDDTLVGWKEDFNMSFTFPVPAQKLATEYVEKIARKVRGKIICGGHSKGGNLAVYAAAFSKPKVQSRIVRIQNFDGPGFDEKALESPEFLAIRGRVDTFVPKSSVIGLLLFHEEEYTIVDSTYQGILQHDTYSWVVERDKFKYLERVTDASRFLDITLKEWIRKMPVDKRELLVDALYELVSGTNAETVTELSENRLGNALSILNTFRGLDDETKKLIFEAFRSLARSAKNTLYLQLQKR